MPFNRATLSELTARVGTSIERHTGQSASQRGDIYHPLAQAVAGVSHGLHGHLQYNVDQLFDDSADDTNLLRRAAEMAIHRIAAARAAGTATATGNNGATIPAESLLQDENQQVYRVTATATVASGTATLQLMAVEPGAVGNQVAGTKLRCISPVPDVDTEVTVIAITGGADIEPVDRVRERLAERRQNPPMGGAAHDYVAWAKAAHADITRAWCYPNTPHIGAVTVRFVTDNLASPIPTQAHIDAVTTYTDSRRPAGMRSFNIGALAGKALDVTFTKLVPNNADIRTAITAELADLIRREGKPGGTLLLSQIKEAISLAAGETDHRINLTDDFTCAPGEFPVLGALTWP